MATKAENIKIDSAHESSIYENPINDYSILLKQYGADYSRSEYYWVVGSITKVQGWILHLSVIKSQLLDLLNLIIPYLVSTSTPFKVVINYNTAINILEGQLGYINLGKVVSIYPENDLNSLLMAQYMINLTNSFKGPNIPTDIHLGSIVYTRYGSFKPIIVNMPDGTIQKYIHDNKKKLVQDLYKIPCSIPDGVDWPYKSICTDQTKKATSLLGNRYYPVGILKRDAKGNVIKALYFKSFLSIRSCIIKQGRNNMGADESGRDIKERLKWQLQLYKDLYDQVPMPTIFEYFEDAGDGYLVMECIKGITLQKWITELFAGNGWIDLSINTKLKIVDCLINVLNIIQRLHRLKYIHRDITTENILIDKTGKLFLIDMELAWSINSLTPNPPFGLGTHGFMSPEQTRIETPTVKEDVYTLGCFMLLFFTNLSPNKWNLANLENLRIKLPSFIGDLAISNAICDCLQISANKRPVVSDLIQVTCQFQKSLQINSKVNKEWHSQYENLYSEVEATIQRAVTGLADPMFLTPNGLWYSQLDRKQKQIGNPQSEICPLTGWHTGLCGPLWVIAKAKQSGFNVELCKQVYSRNWEYLQSRQRDFLTESNSGLFWGGAGVALSIFTGVSNHLLDYEKHIEKLISNCFNYSSKRLDLATGVAGQGLSLLNCNCGLDFQLAQSILLGYVSLLSSTQKSDGSWAMYETFDLFTGQPGIIIFLIAYLNKFPDKAVYNTLNKAIKWLLIKGFKSNGLYKPNSNLDRSSSSLGSILCLIYSYDLLRKTEFKEIAEINLYSFPTKPVNYDFTMHSGLSQLGQVLLDAFMIFKNQNWKERADWIADLYLLTFQNTSPNAGSWSVTEGNISTTDLFKGTSGILHFLLHWYDPMQHYHPLSPKF